jgi:hypothetical protein
MRKLLLLFSLVALAATSAVQAENVYFSEDFEWLDAWCVKGGKNGSAGDAVGTDNYNCYAPYITTPKIGSTTARDTLYARGYDFVRIDSIGNITSVQNASKETVYLQSNYLKFGLTNYQAGVIFPAINNTPATTEGLTLSFDWCPHRVKAAYDEVSLSVNIVNGSDTINVATLEHGLSTENIKLQWVHATVDLSNVTINSNSRIYIRSTQWGEYGVHRWHLDNVKVFGTDASGIETTIADENAPAEYFNLQGVRVANPAKGIYVKRQGNKATKVLVK